MYNKKEEEEKLLAKLVRELKKVDIRYWSTYHIDSVSHGYSLEIGVGDENKTEVKIFGYCLDMFSEIKNNEWSARLGRIYPVYRTNNSESVKRLYDYLEEQEKKQQGKRRRPTALENSLDALLKLSS